VNGAPTVVAPNTLKRVAMEVNADGKTTQPSIAAQPVPTP